MLLFLLTRNSQEKRLWYRRCFYKFLKARKATILHETFNKIQNSLDRRKLSSSLSPGVSMHYTGEKRRANFLNTNIQFLLLGRWNASGRSDAATSPAGDQRLPFEHESRSVWHPGKGFMFFFSPPAGVLKVTCLPLYVFPFYIVFLALPSWCGNVEVDMKSDITDYKTVFMLSV